VTEPTTARPIGLAKGAAEEATGQDAKKYSSSNPVVKNLIARWLGVVQEVVGTDVGVHGDVGVGEGLSLERVLPKGHKAVGLEYRLGKVQAAKERIPLLEGVVADAGMLPIRDRSFDTVTCLEVLEHLDPVEPAIVELARITRGRCIISVPYEPFFRLGNLGRGKNIKLIGNDPEHVQQFSPRKLEAALAPHFGAVDTRVAFPWVVAEAHAR
jgi:SAM-dependent methyltransferase